MHSSVQTRRYSRFPCKHAVASYRPIRILVLNCAYRYSQVGLAEMATNHSVEILVNSARGLHARYVESGADLARFATSVGFGTERLVLTQRASVPG